MTRGPRRSNPRRSNGSARSAQRRRLRSMGLPCAICKGARGPIRYDQPSDHMHPLSFVIDERVPVSRWREFGYASPEACALDPSNQRPAHWICNAQRGNRMGFQAKPSKAPSPQASWPVSEEY